MKLWARVKNIWDLSEYQAGNPTDEYKEPGSEIITLVKKPEPPKEPLRNVFIPRVRISPAEAITNEPDNL